MPETEQRAETRQLNVHGALNEFDPSVHQWDYYYRKMRQYFLANDIVDEIKKRALLLNALCDTAFALISDLCVPSKPEEKSFAELIQLFENHFQPQRAVFAEREAFYGASKDKHESCNEWAARVRRLAMHCEFGNVLNIIVRDKFIIGYNGGIIKEKLFLNKQNVSLEEAIIQARTIEAVECSRKIGSEGISSSHVPLAQVKEEPSDVHQVRKFQNSAGRRKNRGSGSQKSGKHQDPHGKQGKAKCKVCGKSHAAPCKYRNYVCNQCGIKGHLQEVCTNKSHFNSYNHNYLDCMFSLRKKIEQGEHLLNIVSNTGETDKPIAIDVKLNDVFLQMELDTGSAVSAMSEHLFYKLFSNVSLIKTDLKLRCYNGEILIPCGIAKMNICSEKINDIIDIVIIKSGGPPILGRDWFQKHKHNIKNFNLIENVSNKIEKLCLKYTEVFSGKLGTFTAGKVNLKLKDNVKPIFFKPRPLPFALKSKVEAEIQRLVKEKILFPTVKSEWGTPIVPILKSDGSIRVCGDYKITLNPNLENFHYPLPRIQDLFNELKGGKYFTKFDMGSAYQQMLLDDAAKMLTTISTHLGLFAYNRLPFGIKTAPSIFQLMMEKLLIGLEGVTSFLDDILITGSTESEHLSRIEQVLRRFQEFGLTLNREKCCFFQESVVYLGFVINSEGLHPSPEKTEVLVHAASPTNKTELKSALGMFNYYRNFIPHFADICQPMYELLKEDTEWKWTRNCEAAFHKLKTVVCSAKVLAHYDPSVPVKLSVDASQNALGAVLCHVFPNGMERPISFASRTLSETEKAYAQIDKEALAIVFGVRKFNQYLFGRHFVLVTDNKPLLAILGPKKGIPTMAANRLQRYAVFLSGYDYDIEYTRSEKNIADYFSRLSREIRSNTSDDEASYTYLKMITQDSPWTLDKEKIKTETTADPILKEVYKYTREGWPLNCPEEYKPFFLRKEQITIEDDLLMWGYRLIIPSSCREAILKEIHGTHMGISKSKSLARSYVWWPTCDQDIERYCRECSSCMKFRSQPTKSPLHPWPIPEGPWERVHIDFFGPIQGKMFMIIVDAYSRWLEVLYMPSITSEETIKKLHYIFGRWGIPRTIVSDNGRSFTSAIFKRFLEENHIQHVYSPPYHPQTNGLAEVCVRTTKTHLYRALQTNMNILDALNKYLLYYRNCIHSGTGETPSKLFIGRSLRMKLDFLVPNKPPNLNTENCLCDVKLKMLNYRDKCIKTFGGKRKAKINVNDKVLVRDYKNPMKPSWVRGTVTMKRGPRNFEVRTNNNRNHYRHTDQLLKLVDDIDFSECKINNRRTVNEECKIVEDDNVKQLDIPSCSSSPPLFSRPMRIRKPPERFCP